MSYKTEFPDFVLDVEIPTGFADCSWHNDACPHFDMKLPDGNYLVLWVDYADRSRSEFPTMPRFNVDLNDNDYSYVETLLASDNWDDVLKFIDAFLAYPEFFAMDIDELRDRIDVALWKMPADDNARNWDGFDELAALELALKLAEGKK